MIGWGTDDELDPKDGSPPYFTPCKAAIEDNHRDVTGSGCSGQIPSRKNLS